MEPKKGQVLASLVMVALSWWMMLPAQKQREHRMRTALILQSVSQRLAQACARYAMSEELAGDPAAAGAGYRAAYRLMTGIGERAGRWYRQGSDA